MAGTVGGTGDGRRGRGLAWSLRTRSLVVVALSAVPGLMGALVGTFSLHSLDADVAEIRQHSVQTMVALADLRDMEGDMRVEVHDLLNVPATERVKAAGELRETDDVADADIAAFRAARGSTADAEGSSFADFVAKLATWREVRNQKVVAAVVDDRLAEAQAAIGDDLQKADDAMAEPLDRVFDLERAGAAARVSAASSTYHRALVWVPAVIAVGLVLSALVAWLLISGPVRLLGRITEVVSGGDLRARVGVVDGTDVGRLAGAVDELLGTIQQQQEDIATHQAARERQVAANFARQQEAEREVRERAQAVIDETGEAVLAELKGVMEQADAVRSASGEIDARVQDADSMTRAVVGRAGNADEVVGAVTESLRRVAGIAQLIAGVAEQTNLLALNATIEAARAGDAGRGFSVVANEVKELAAETGRSTGEISTTVGALEADALAMATTIQEMSHGVSTMSEATSRVSEVAARQRESVERLDACVQEAVQRIQAMSQLTERLERRLSRRVVVNAPAVVRWGGHVLEGEVVDISESGMRVWLDGAIPEPGDDVSVEIRSDAYTASLRGRVVRLEASTPPHEVGMTFVGLRGDELQRLRTFLGSMTTV